MVAAQSFDGKNFTGLKHLSCGADTWLITANDILGGLQVVSRSAFVASHRLRVEAPVGGIVVLGRAMLIELPRPHRGICAVVRQSENHGVARTANRAIYIRIEIARVRGIEHFVQAIFTDRQVGRNSRRRSRAAPALSNCKFAATERLRRLDFNIRDSRGGWRFRLERLNECFQALILALQENFNTLLSVEHPA